VHVSYILEFQRLYHSTPEYHIEKKSGSASAKREAVVWEKYQSKAVCVTDKTGKFLFQAQRHVR